MHHWRKLTLYNLETGDPADDTTTLLSEYRKTGGIAGYAFERPSDSSPEALERASESGPTVEEIDWSGFPEA